MQLDWRLSSIDVESTYRAQKIIDREIRRTGLGKILFQMDEDTPPPQITGGWHHMGTTRMHDDPEKGVVDANSKVYGLSNLYIAGPSVFPTGGYANPCITIIALSMRLADYLKELFK
jgi:choline dehydrogenase-like flavoprotein